MPQKSQESNGSAKHTSLPPGGERRESANPPPSRVPRVTAPQKMKPAKPAKPRKPSKKK